MKGVILIGGKGTRLRPFSHTQPKPLIAIANKPMLLYAMENLRDAGINEVAIVLGRVFLRKVKKVLDSGKKFGVEITYIIQEEPKGIAHAIRLTKDFVNDEKFLVVLGDNIMEDNLREYKDKFEKSKFDASILLYDVDEPSRFGIAEIKDDKITSIVEKPERPLTNHAVIGVYFLTSKIFDVIDDLKPSDRGEFEITDALQALLEKSQNISFDFISGWWKDVGISEDFLHANKLILDVIRKNLLISKEHENSCMSIGKNCQISDNAVISELSVIGDNCKIGPDVKIGAYVSIGNNCTIERCAIDNSIIMDDCAIITKSNLSNSIIAKESEIIDNGGRKFEFLLGEHSKVKI